MTENNVAAQDGDEPMDYAEQLRAAVETVCEGWTLPPGARKTLETALWAAQVSPRATADVERDAKRQAERVERLVRAAKVYAFNYLQDEHEEAELCTCGPKQHAELVELFAALAAIATTKPGA